MLIAFLALQNGNPAERRHLAATLWPDSTEETGLFNLRQVLAGLKRENLEVDKIFIRSGIQFLAIDKSRVRVDVDEFLALKDSVPEEALRLYTGELLKFWDEPWLTAKRSTLEQLALNTLTSLATRTDGSRRVAYLRRAAELAPLEEALQQDLYRAMAASGDVSAIQVAYHQFKKRLGKELEFSPSPETVSVVRTLLRTPSRVTSMSEQALVKHRLPTSSGPIIGREQELDEVNRLLNESPLVTLLGPGGVGKTRLAIEVGKNRLQAFPDGVWFVDLSAVRGEREVTQTICQCLNLRNGSDQNWEELLMQSVAGSSALLILDNCEHLLEACSDLLTRLQRDAKRVHVLATSRMPIRLDWERRVYLDPLALPEVSYEGDQYTSYSGLSLFQESATKFTPNFLISRANIEAVLAICLSIDGLPLGIKMAAARISTLGLDELARRLAYSLSLLRSVDRTSRPEKAHLEAVVGWSFELLSKQEQTLLIRLGIFTGGCSVIAAEEVCSSADLPKSVIVDCLQGLVDASMIRIKQNRFYLYETVRQFVLSRNDDPKGLRECSIRFVEYMEKVCAQTEENIREYGSRKAAEIIQPEVENVRKALRLCLTHSFSDQGLRLANHASKVFSVIQRDDEAKAWLTKWLYDPSIPKTSSERLRALALAGRFLMSPYADFDPILSRSESMKVSQELLELADSAGDPSLKAKAMINLARANIWWDGGRAEEYLQKAIMIGRAAPEACDLQISLRLAAQRAYDRKDFEEGSRLIDEADQTCLALGDISERINCLVAKSFFFREECHYEKAEAVLAQIDRILEDRPDALVEAQTQLRHAELALDRWDFNLLIAALQRCEQFFGRSPRHLHSFLIDGMSRYYAASQGKVRDAFEGASEVLERLVQTGDSHPASYWHAACILLEALSLGLAKIGMNDRAAVLFGAAKMLRSRDWAYLSPSVHHRWSQLASSADFTAYPEQVLEGSRMTVEEICLRVSWLEVSLNDSHKPLRRQFPSRSDFASNL